MDKDNKNQSTITKDSQNGVKQIKMNIKVSDEAAKGVYSNISFVHNNENEFVLDFIFAEPGRPQAHVVSRVITNPRAAKQMAIGLKSLVERYEASFGTINIHQKSDPVPPGSYN
ncbi:MAG: DUF3467 domain-containing protein [Deltaproteobacteria bacterium]|nr:DUF3467 domain-containing protein [Deltaproteobacteria bacterium]